MFYPENHDILMTKKKGGATNKFWGNWNWQSDGSVLPICQGSADIVLIIPTCQWLVSKEGKGGVKLTGTQIIWPRRLPSDLRCVEAGLCQHSEVAMKLCTYSGWVWMKW